MGYGRVLAQIGYGTHIPRIGNRFSHLIRALSGKAHKHVCAYLAGGIPRPFQVMYCLLEFSVREFFPQIVVQLSISGLQPQPDGSETGFVKEPRRFLIYIGDMKPVRAVKPKPEVAPEHLVKKEADMVFGIHKKGVIVKGKVGNMMVFIPEEDFLEQIQGMPLVVGRAEIMRGAIGTFERASNGTQEADVVYFGKKVKGRIQAKEFHLFIGEKIWYSFHQGLLYYSWPRLTRSGEDDICLRMVRRMFRAEGGIDPAQDYRYIRMDLFGNSNGFEYPGIPIGHNRGNHYGRRFPYAL